MARRTNSQFLLFSAITTLGWRTTRAISFAEGEDLVASGTFRRIVDDTGRHIGYQPTDGDKQPKPKPSDRFDAPSLLRAEIEANAGLRGRSRTSHLPERMRVHRLHPKSGKLMPEEDFIERVQAKVKVWPEPMIRADKVEGLCSKAPR